MIQEAKYLFGDSEHRAYQINETSVLVVRRMRDLSSESFENIVENSPTTAAFVRAAAVYIDSEGEVEVDYRIVTQVVMNDYDWLEGRRDFYEEGSGFPIRVPLVQIVPAMAEHFEDDTVFDCFVQMNEFQMLLEENEEGDHLEQSVGHRLIDEEEVALTTFGENDLVGVDGT